VKALGTRTLDDSAPDGQARLIVASGPPLARLRIAQALAGSPSLMARFDSPIGDDISQESNVRQLVVYCESVSRQQVERFAELKRNAPHLSIVAVCESADRRAVRRLLDAGIDGVVFADQLEDALMPTVAAVLAGQMVVPRDLRDSVEKPSLSSRERQILALVVMGLTNQEIAARMFLAESTVKSHLSSAYSKLGVRSRSEAVTVILDRPESLGTGIAAVAPGSELRVA
jgi:DNA-binding NarL/FixJ family response regulator